MLQSWKKGFWIASSLCFLCASCGGAQQPEDTQATSSQSTSPEPEEVPVVQPTQSQSADAADAVIQYVDAGEQRHTVPLTDPLTQGPAPGQNAAFLVDQAMRQDGDLGVYGDLSAGLLWASQAFRVTLTQRQGEVFVDMGPRSEGGHDFAFAVDEATGELRDPVIGEVLPPPDI